MSGPAVYLTDFVKTWDSLAASYPAQRATLLNHFYATVIQRSNNSEPRSPTADAHSIIGDTISSGIEGGCISPTNAHVAITVNGYAVRWQLHPVNNQSTFFEFTPPHVIPNHVETSMLIIRFSAYLKILVALYFKGQTELILLHLQCLLFLLNCQNGTEHAKGIVNDYVSSSAGPGLLMELLTATCAASVAYSVLFDTINILSLSSRKNKESLCRLDVIQNIVGTISAYVEEPAEEDQDFAKKSKNHLMTAAIESSAKEVLLELCSGNPRHFSKVKNGILTLLGSTVMSKRIGVQVLLAILSSGVVTDSTSMFVLPVLALTRNLDVMLQYEAIELLSRLVVENCESVFISVSATLNGNSGSGTGAKGVLMALKTMAGVPSAEVNIEVTMVKTGIIEELLNVIVNQVHTDEVYFHAADCLRQGSVLEGAGNMFKKRLTVYVKKKAHLDNRFWGGEGAPRVFVTRLLADASAVRYIRDKLHDKACELYEKKRIKRLEEKKVGGNFFVTEGEGGGAGGMKDAEFEDLLNDLDNFDLKEARMGGSSVEPPKPKPPPRKSAKSPRSGKGLKSPRGRKPDPNSLTHSPYKTLMENLINNSIPEMSEEKFKSAQLKDEFEKAASTAARKEMQQQHLVFVDTAPPVMMGGRGGKGGKTKEKKVVEEKEGGDLGLMIGGNKLKGTLEFAENFPLI
ncbi:hypothetical protein TL16_g00718 [Triparma laevis f. inornata]|uniref:Uncharacterized protein n=1 Tax=Triparma laevis f. inornata TaxID=1714386 RepID=A0A9W6ZDI9_9STRA|nr:hypothetical protein TL16_g00718 [Triparma laevis f. inornata]